MFRKPKKNAKNKAGLRRKREDEEDGEPDETNLAEALREQQQQGSTDTTTTAIGKRPKTEDNSNSNTKTTILHQFEASETGPVTQKEMATRTNEHHPTQVIDRGNKFLAGPIKAPTNIRTTCRFDYQPDICKDYKDTGFCGFGDTCIYLHDRGDTLSGWQLELKWQQEQKDKKERQKEEMEAFINGKNGTADASSGIDTEDGLPFACYLCREHFTDPVVTNCAHYFCQVCLLNHVKEHSNLCPICNTETHGVFHEPTKLISKKRKVSGRDSTWQEFQEACQKGITNDEEED